MRRAARRVSAAKRPPLASARRRPRTRERAPPSRASLARERVDRLREPRVVLPPASSRLERSAFALVRARRDRLLPGRFIERRLDRTSRSEPSVRRAFGRAFAALARKPTPPRKHPSRGGDVRVREVRARRAAPARVFATGPRPSRKRTTRRRPRTSMARPRKRRRRSSTRRRTATRIPRRGRPASPPRAAGPAAARRPARARGPSRDQRRTPRARDGPPPRTAPRATPTVRRPSCASRSRTTRGPEPRPRRGEKKKTAPPTPRPSTPRPSTPRPSTPRRPRVRGASAGARTRRTPPRTTRRPTRRSSRRAPSAAARTATRSRPSPPPPTPTRAKRTRTPKAPVGAIREAPPSRRRGATSSPPLRPPRTRLRGASRVSSARPRHRWTRRDAASVPPSPRRSRRGGRRSRLRPRFAPPHLPATPRRPPVPLAAARGSVAHPRGVPSRVSRAPPPRSGRRRRARRTPPPRAGSSPSAARRLSRICSSFAAARATAVRGW